MKLIYLASPYSHRLKRVEKLRYEKVTEIAAHLTLIHKVAFFLPITQSYNMCKVIPELGGSFEKWRDIDLFMVERSDELWVVMMNGWRESVGVQAEIELAKKLGKPISYIVV